MTSTLKRVLIALGLSAAIFATSYLIAMQTVTVYAGETYNRPVSADTFINHDFFPVATTTTATSTNAAALQDRTVRIDGAEQATFYFSRGGATGANTGSSKFEIEVSPDGSNWYDFNRLYLNDASKTATSTVWITAATSTVVASMDLTHDAYRFVRCQVVEVTDGEHDCSVSVEY